MPPLDRLQDWYERHCNGEWEHRYGVIIETLDNPGWRLRVELSDTPLAGEPFDDVREDASERVWLHCSKRSDVFEGACGPRQLERVIEVFLRWADERERGAR
jgi:Immunity protein 53